MFQTWQVRQQIMKIAQGISVLGVSKKNLAKVDIQIPCKDEQMKITTLMQKIDKKISRTITQITQTQEFKKGLLQQMFV
jgi:type I restriction enzyme S subunit